eukprot:CAMPEP_0174855884 /NCGR_PEP_ID=MMETSP1114-20130205/34471_1 /TAXON_ID=312471 /ORGANISM="Neobodo designis, Strain CCAP 1951/1" /LENGTH=358 /DNA_ID=CAMNT_0016090657 /DNA_START=56 /DNA_END=1129 /DNA_ORIENTATION=+
MELLLLSQFNVDTPLPTVFELVAQDRLGDSLHGAFKFALTSLAQSVPRLAPAVHWFDEGYLVFDGLLQHLFLSHVGATMAEHAFGLRRSGLVPTAPRNRAADAALASATSDGPSSAGGVGAGAEAPNALAGLTLVPLTRAQRVATLLLTVLLSYARRRLFDYTRMLNSTKPDDVDERRRIEAQYGAWAAAVNGVIAAVYPWVHAAMEFSNLAFMLGYLADRTPHFSWQLWATRATIRRATRNDMAAVAGSPAAQRAVRVAQLALMGIAVAFRVLDWWNTNDGRDASNTVVQDTLPAPKPPKPPAPADGVEAPSDGTCGACRRSVANPCVNAASGYVFCYPCLHQAIQATAACPVTRAP